MGLASGLYGPTFVYLTYLLETDIETLSYSHIFGNIGYLVGSLVCGAVSEKFDFQLQLSLSTICLGVTVIFCPWMPSVYMYYAADFVKNISMSYLDTLSQSYIIALWSSHRLKDPVMQGMHSFWSLGSTLSPFIIIPFLSDLPQDSTPHNESTPSLCSMNNSCDEINQIIEGSGQIDKDEFQAVRYGFGVIGGLIIATSVFDFLGYGIYTSRKINKSVKNTSESDKSKSGISNYIILTFQFCFCAIFIWCLFIPESFLSTFVIVGLNWDATYGSMIASLFWICYGLGGLLAIPVSYFVSPGKMVTFDLTLALLAF